jgi:small subunit ribosomal protein S4
MGDPRRLRKKYTTPSNSFQRARFAEEARYLGRYGLRNKKEFWKHKTQLSRFREMARKSRVLSEVAQAQHLKEMRSSLGRLGLVSANAAIDDILSINIDQILERRLQTLVFKKGFAKTIYQARQLITHGHIALKGLVVDSPSALVSKEAESTIAFANNSAFFNQTAKVWGDKAAPTQDQDITKLEIVPKRKEERPRGDRRGRGGFRGKKKEEQ